MQELPSNLVSLLDGEELEAKIGSTLVLTACQPDEWPHIALLSVGEVLAVAPAAVRLLLYGGSGTSEAFLSTRRGLLLVVLDGATYKLRLAVTAHSRSRAGLLLVAADVERWDIDEVSYARMRHGIEYELTDPKATLSRWEDQVNQLRAETA